MSIDVWEVTRARPLFGLQVEKVEVDREVVAVVRPGKVVEVRLPVIRTPQPSACSSSADRVLVPNSD
eukprot:SAG11_NODE_1284_length_5305_cov_1.528621_5_plen_67_part_00